jgi:ribosomal protein L7/L12
MANEVKQSNLFCQECGDELATFEVEEGHSHCGECFEDYMIKEIAATISQEQPETEPVESKFASGDRVKVNSRILLNQELGTVQYVKRTAPFGIAIQLDNRIRGKLNVFSQDELEMIEPDTLDQPASEPETEVANTQTFDSHWAEIALLIANGKRIKAIKAIQGVFDVDMRTAKDIAEWDGDFLILINEMRAYAIEHGKIKTIKHFRKETGLGLRESTNIFKAAGIMDKRQPEPEAEEIVIQYVVQSITEHRNYWIDSSIEDSLSEAQETIRWYRQNNRLNRRYRLIERTITTLDKVYQIT